MTTSPSEKRCARCGLVKPLAAFHVRANASDGRCSVCKPCRVEDRKRGTPSPKDLYGPKTAACIRYIRQTCKRAGSVKRVSVHRLYGESATTKAVDHLSVYDVLYEGVDQDGDVFYGFLERSNHA